MPTTSLPQTAHLLPSDTCYTECQGRDRNTSSFCPRRTECLPHCFPIDACSSERLIDHLPLLIYVPVLLLLSLIKGLKSHAFYLFLSSRLTEVVLSESAGSADYIMLFEAQIFTTVCEMHNFGIMKCFSLAYNCFLSWIFNLSITKIVMKLSFFFFLYLCLHGFCTFKKILTLEQLVLGFFFSFRSPCAACKILVPQPGIEPLSPAVEAQSLNRWTAREVPFWAYFLHVSLFLYIKTIGFGRGLIWYCFPF